ncbi:hypothetical protein H310_13918 [Aphanomyces invadans]|uniref:Kinesin motor domain-containing protein n=1 Tax=Aphanomyces invadans TaxID=157072 RepID=A0A024TD72_9STRA|nr:hypothetical protein H310_13918 [Aphanomyces invadans]ETV91536.1 hypothetical protein H310_13918 [Aphanomyces invadans]|eukprot:XP_008879804.1 hypothetical protein H310_13918 [Aphanomyces invadans]
MTGVTPPSGKAGSRSELTWTHNMQPKSQRCVIVNLPCGVHELILCMCEAYDMEHARLSAIAHVQRDNAIRALAYSGMQIEDWRWETHLTPDKVVAMTPSDPTGVAVVQEPPFDVAEWINWLIERALRQADVTALQTALLHANMQLARTQSLYDDLVVTSEVAAALSSVITDVVMGGTTSAPRPVLEAATAQAVPSAMASLLQRTKWKHRADLEPPQEYANLIACELDMEVLKEQLDSLKGGDLPSTAQALTLKGLAQSTTVFHAKTAAKQRIKEWLQQFQATYNRDPTLSDKAQVKGLYVAFKQAEDDHTRLKQDTAAAKAVYELKVAEVEALQGSVNMRQFPHHTLVAHLRAALDDTHAKVEALQSRLKTMTVAPEPRNPPVPDQRPLSAALQRQPSLQGPAMTATPNVPPAMATQPSLTALPASELPLSSHEVRPVAPSPLPVSEALPGIDAPSQPVVDTQDPRFFDVQSPPVLRELPTASSMQRAGGSLAAPSNDAQKRASLGAFPSIDALSVMSTREGPMPAMPEGSALPRQVATDPTTSQSAEVVQDLQNALAAEHEVSRALMETQCALQEELLSWRIQAASTGGARVGGDASQDGDDEDLNDRDDRNGVVNDADVPADVVATSLAAEPKLQGDVNGDDVGAAIQRAKGAIEAGKIAWNQGDKAGCYTILASACHAILPAAKGHATDGVVVSMAITEAATVGPAKGAVVLRKALDAFVAAHPNADANVVQPQQSQAKAQRMSTAAASSGGGIDGPAKNNATAANELKQKLKVVESKWKADRVKLNQLEQALAKASAGGSKSDGDAVVERVWAKKLADAEKKAQKVLDDVQTQSARQVHALKADLAQATATVADMTGRVHELTATVTALRTQTARMSELEKDLVVFQAEAATAATLSTTLTTLTQQYATLESQYREEQALRKKYYNTIEDMKGKIRVYCRCRPMSTSELERDCQSCVRFLDDFTLEVDTARGPRSFTYDAVFNPSHTQDQVFEDTKHLLQSALDGYNVCIFAYGQTGSGKTFTMTGTEAHPGITRRLIHLMFSLQTSQAANQTIAYEATMLELYNDQLIDLLAQLDSSYKEDKAPKLDIKKNDKGMVVVTNAASKACTSADQTLRMFDAANKKRQVGSTKMNAESSRSHSVFTVLIQNYNKTTKQTSVGKLSLVDLAGSERAGKTGATAERLKEAQAINKSLSALGDVISALSTNEKFIPYRNNKLTQLMQDSLGGNAKTLMFVNISPADYNQDETQTSLSYAARVKLITNQASKTSDSEEVAKLKAIIKQLQAGGVPVDDASDDGGAATRQ